MRQPTGSEAMLCSQLDGPVDDSLMADSIHWEERGVGHARQRNVDCGMLAMAMRFVLRRIAPGG